MGWVLNLLLVFQFRPMHIIDSTSLHTHPQNIILYTCRILLTFWPRIVWLVQLCLSQQQILKLYSCTEVTDWIIKFTVMLQKCKYVVVPKILVPPPPAFSVGNVHCFWRYFAIVIFAHFWRILSSNRLYHQPCWICPHKIWQAVSVW